MISFLNGTAETVAKAIWQRRKAREHMPRVHLGGEGEIPPEGWEDWLGTLFGQHVTTFADHHAEFWEHVWAIGPESKPDPFTAFWPREGGKSTSAELAVVAMGARDCRRYAWYVRGTQENADDNVTNIAAMLESESIERFHPVHADRKLSKYGHSRGWTSSRLRTAGGFIVDAIGLDTAARGLKVDEVRPDLIVLDDLDGLHDTDRATRKKIETLTHSILPAGTAKTAVIAIQNLIIPNGIFTRLSDGRADFLHKRILSGPHPAIRDMQTEIREDERGFRHAVIVGGEPTWDGQDTEACQRLIDRIGLRAFLRECQHQVKEREGALWKSASIGRREKAPKLRRVVVAVDPSGGGDEIGIIACGLGTDGRGYVLADVTQPGVGGPLNWGRKAVHAYHAHEADRIVAEKNFGGDMVASNIQVAAAEGDGNGKGPRRQVRVPVKLVTSSRGKAIRAEPVASLYEDGLIDHVGTFPELEAEMTGWVPGDPDSPNRLDALVFAFTELMLAPGVNVRAWFPGMEEVASG